MEPTVSRSSGSPLDYQGRENEVEAFTETKAGVKGLVESDVEKIPRFFIIPAEMRHKALSSSTFQLPVISLEGRTEVNGDRRKEAVRSAAETWGFFQLVDHGIPERVMAGLLDSIRRFHEQPREVRKEWYSHDISRRIRYYSYGYAKSLAPANWRDSLACFFQDDPLESFAIPQICIEETIEYMKCVERVKNMLLEILSEALGLEGDQLAKLGCMESRNLILHYYSACPQPDLTLGATNHYDPYFLTLLLKSNIDGLQVLHQNHWVDVPYLEGALVANISDLMQIITNGRFESVEHRVLAGRNGPRISAACFFYPAAANFNKPYGPIEQLISDRNPRLYKQVTYKEYSGRYISQGLDGRSVIPHFHI